MLAALRTRKSSVAPGRICQLRPRSNKGVGGPVQGVGRVGINLADVAQACAGFERGGDAVGDPEVGDGVGRFEIGRAHV